MAPGLQETLNTRKALIFRATHRTNIPWLLKNGLHCSNSDIKDPGFVSIGNPELILKRTSRPVPIPPKGSLADYIPFYFTPFSPMLYNIKTGVAGVEQRANQEIVILVAALRRIAKSGSRFVFTDRHAYLQAAEFSADLGELDMVDWELLQKRDFQRDLEDPGKMERYQAEALIYRELPAAALLGAGCYDRHLRDSIRSEVHSCGLELKIEALPGWYF